MMTRSTRASSLALVLGGVEQQLQQRTEKTTEEPDETAAFVEHFFAESRVSVGDTGQRVRWSRRTATQLIKQRRVDISRVEDRLETMSRQILDLLRREFNSALRDPRPDLPHDLFDIQLIARGPRSWVGRLLRTALAAAAVRPTASAMVVRPAARSVVIHRHQYLLKRLPHSVRLNARMRA